MSSIHGRIIATSSKHYVAGETLKLREVKCQAYILFIKDLEVVLEVVGPQADSKVVVIPQASQWQVDTFFSSSSLKIINLLVIADPSLQTEEFNLKVW